MSTETTGDGVTAESVRSAEEDAAKAQNALEDLETRLSGGDLTVTPDDLSAAEKVIRHAKLAAAGVRSLWDRRKADERTTRLKAFADRIREEAPKSGTGLAAALQAVEDAAREFKRLAVEHDANVHEWTHIAMSNFGIANRTSEAGVGIDGGHDLYIDGLLVPTVDPDRVFANTFYARSNPHEPLPIREPGDQALIATHAMLARIGEGL